MIYVSKINQEAIDFCVEFLNLGFNEEENRYIGISYEQIRNPVNVFRGFFVSEQNEKCCYCCRTIDNSNKTELEHIIPQSKNTIDEFELYYNLSNILRDNVVPQNNFESAIERLVTPPFPHHIAYHNIVASCDGKSFQYSNQSSFTCCNRQRGNDFIPPFNLIENSIEYFPDGTIVYTKDPTNREFLEVLNLEKPFLNQVRRLWFLFSESHLNLDDILNDEYTNSIEEKIVRFAIANSKSPADDSNLTDTFSNIGIWSVFKQFNYFFDYYKKK